MAPPGAGPCGALPLIFKLATRASLKPMNINETTTLRCNVYNDCLAWFR